jgi:nucleoside-diphosphate-sugar epimerase
VRALVVGGTRFVGRAIVDDLDRAGHTVAVLHRGVHELDAPTRISHFHGSRHDASFVSCAAGDFRPDVVIDVAANTGSDARSLLAAVTPDCRFVVISSMDVYRAWHSVRSGALTDGVPLVEESPLREQRYLYGDGDEGQAEFENLDVEEAYATRAATVCRLPMVYGEHDHARREGFVLDRLRAGRSRIPVGPGGWLWSRGYVRDLAAGVRLAAERDDVAGQVFHLCEAPTWPIALWIQAIAASAGHEVELVRVSTRAVPRDLWMTGAIPQTMLADASKAREMLNWMPRDPADAVAASVKWHLNHPSSEVRSEFPEDDEALTSERSPSPTAG